MNLETIDCESIFQKAYENRYTWENDFLGYKGKCIFLLNDNIHKGTFELGRDFKSEIKNINDEEVVKRIGSQLFEVSIHRVKREFKSVHSKNKFNFLNNSENGVEILITGKNDGDKYRVKDGLINMVYRKIHGIIIEIFVQEFLDTGVGFLSKKYTSQQIDPITLKKSSPKYSYEDNFINIGPKNVWLLNSRTIKYLNKNQKEEIQKFIFEELSLLK